MLKSEARRARESEAQLSRQVGSQPLVGQFVLWLSQHGSLCLTFLVTPPCSVFSAPVIAASNPSACRTVGGETGSHAPGPQGLLLVVFLTQLFSWLLFAFFFFFFKENSWEISDSGEISVIFIVTRR